MTRYVAFTLVAFVAVSLELHAESTRSVEERIQGIVSTALDGDGFPWVDTNQDRTRVLLASECCDQQDPCDHPQAIIHPNQICRTPGGQHTCVSDIYNRQCAEWVDGDGGSFCGTCIF
jgi:hypothetical protein